MYLCTDPSHKCRQVLAMKHITSVVGENTEPDSHNNRFESATLCYEDPSSYYSLLQNLTFISSNYIIRD